MKYFMLKVAISSKGGTSTRGSGSRWFCIDMLHGRELVMVFMSAYSQLAHDVEITRYDVMTSV